MTKDGFDKCDVCGQLAALKCSGKYGLWCKCVLYCNKDCQRKDWPNHKQNCRIYDVRPSSCTSQDDRGLFAKRKIDQGELILKESALVTVTTPYTPKTIINHVAELRTKVKSLEEDDQETFFSLSIARPGLCTKGQGDTRIMGVFHTNAIPLQQLDKKKAAPLGLAVFPTFSRINHSCCPNVQWSFNMKDNKQELRAVREIAKDEEILASYLESIEAMRADRQKELQAKYNFECRCDICILEGDELTQNEKIRREIIGLTNNMEDVYKAKPQKALQYAKMKLERMEVMRKQQITGLSQAYMDCYELAKAINEEDIAEIYKARGKAVAKITRGENSIWSQVE